MRSYLLIAPDSNELFRLFLGDNFESITGLADDLEELPLLLCRGISPSLGVSSDRIGEFFVVVVLVVVIHCILVAPRDFHAKLLHGPRLRARFAHLFALEGPCSTGDVLFRPPVCLGVLLVDAFDNVARDIFTVLE